MREKIKGAAVTIGLIGTLAFAGTQMAGFGAGAQTGPTGPFPGATPIVPTATAEPVDPTPTATAEPVDPTPTATAEPDITPTATPPAPTATAPVTPVGDGTGGSTEPVGANEPETIVVELPTTGTGSSLPGRN